MRKLGDLGEHVVVDLLGAVVEALVDGAAPAVAVEGEVLAPALLAFAEEVVGHGVDLEVHEPFLVGRGPLEGDDDLTVVVVSEEHAGDRPPVDVLDLDVSRGARAEHYRARFLQVSDGDGVRLGAVRQGGVRGVPVDGGVRGVGDGGGPDGRVCGVWQTQRCRVVWVQAEETEEDDAEPHVCVFDVLLLLLLPACLLPPSCHRAGPCRLGGLCRRPLAPDILNMLACRPEQAPQPYRTP